MGDEEKKENDHETEQKSAMGGGEKDRKTSRILVGIIILLALALVGAGIWIFSLKKNGSGKEKTAGTTATVTEETAESETAGDASTDKPSEKEKADTSSGDPAKKQEVYADFSVEGDAWGDKPTVNISINIHNGSAEDISDWKVTVPGFQDAEIQGSWNGKFKIQDDILTVTSTGEDWNKTIAAGGELLNIGGTVQFPDSDALEAVKRAVPVLTAGGKEYKKTAGNAETTGTTEKSTEAGKTEADSEKTDAGSGKTDKSGEKSGKTPVQEHGALSVKGTDLVDKNGDPYQLKGVSTHGLAWFPQYVTEDTFRTFRDDWGANLIRLAMYTAENGGYCEGGDQEKLKSLVEDGVQDATDLGMYVIIDWHILHDETPLKYQDEAVAFFQEMSEKYADYDNVLYEICNEPNGSATWQDVKQYAETVIPEIRKNDKDAVIIVGTPTWSHDVDVAAADPLTGYDNIMYAVHFYAATHKEDLRSKVEKAHEAGLPVFVSEFSICDASGNGSIDYDSAEAWMDLIRKLNLSYAAWNISNKAETSSLLKSSCTKTADWSESDLSETGTWLKQQMQK